MCWGEPIWAFVFDILRPKHDSRQFENDLLNEFGERKTSHFNFNSIKVVSIKIVPFAWWDHQPHYNELAVCNHGMSLHPRLNGNKNRDISLIIWKITANLSRLDF